MNLGYETVKGVVKSDDTGVCLRLSVENNNDDHADHDHDHDAVAAAAADTYDDGDHHHHDDDSHGWLRRVTTLLFV